MDIPQLCLPQSLQSGAPCDLTGAGVVLLYAVLIIIIAVVGLWYLTEEKKEDI